MPLVADQPWIAERVGALGAAAMVDSPERAGAAVGEVLKDPAYRAAAQSVARHIQAMNPLADALRVMLDRVVHGTPHWTEEA